MEKVKFADGSVIELAINGVVATDKTLRLRMTTDASLLDIEALVNDKTNVSRIEVLSTEDEVIGVYTGYVMYNTLTKSKNVYLYSVYDTSDGEPVENKVFSDVVDITLRKPNEVEERLASLEESVDILTLAALGF